MSDGIDVAHIDRQPDERPRAGVQRLDGKQRCNRRLFRRFPCEPDADVDGLDDRVPLCRFLGEEDGAVETPGHQDG